MDTKAVTTVNAVSNIEGIVGAVILLILSFIFCALALFALVHYIRRRYKLYKEINRIPQELLIKESYRNHLKNLKIKCFINNFIIVILIIEIIQNWGQLSIYLSYLIITLIKDQNFRSLVEIQVYLSLFTISIYYSLVPVLSMLMDFLWLVYRKYEYKYSMIRWTWYIVIRALVLFLILFSINFISIPVGYEDILYDLVNTFLGIFSIFDFIQFVYYARKFYLHLKSREKEIQLFYFDKKAYLDSKYLRIHFKIATILVGIALFFFTLANSSTLFVIINDIPDYIPIPRQLNNMNLSIINIYFDFIHPSYIIYQVLFIFNYFYIFIVVVYKSYRDGQKLKNINDYIKPIMKQYHDNYYNRYTNYA